VKTYETVGFRELQIDMEAIVVDVGSKLLKAGFAIPDQTPAMVCFYSLFCSILSSFSHL
jgi:hypothetical protein